MFDHIIRWSLEHRITVLAVAGCVSLVGAWSLWTMKVDILPDINRPTITIFAEAEGLASEEVERLILTPLEAAISGTPGLERVRGTASFGLAIINAEFGWGTDTFRNRQIIQERFSQSQLPNGVKPVLGPVGSIMGEIMWVGLTSSAATSTSDMELRTLADWTIRPALLRVPGVSTVLVMGGDVREWQVNVNAEQARRYGVHLEQINSSVSASLANKSGGILVQNGKEFPIRILVASDRVDALKELAIGEFEGRPVRLADVASVVEGPSPVRGSASIDGTSGVILRVVKQPDAETLNVTAEIDRVLTSLRASLPSGVMMQNDLFRQEWFIHSGLNNVLDALRDGTILVVIILILFLMNLRTTMITLVAIPLSILTAAIVFKWFGFSVNVMTLGGLAIAVGELVDDAIVDVENVFRKLRDWRATGRIEKSKEVIFHASSQVRNSIVYATALVAVVFLPVFFIPGVEGRLLTSLGAAYLISLLASLIVSLSVTPVLCSLLLPNARGKSHESETSFVRFLKKRIEPIIYWTIRHVYVALFMIVASLVVSIFLYASAGKEGIPPFNEGSATVLILLPAGTDLATSNTYAARVEEALRHIRGVRRVSHITGRAGVDAHESGTNRSEMQVVFEPGMEKERKRLFLDIQTSLNQFDGAEFSLGQPITHRVEELLSGVRAPVVIKVFGDSTQNMRTAAEMVLRELRREYGMKNPQIQKDVFVPEFRIFVDRNRLAEYKLSAGAVAQDLEMGLMGMPMGQARVGPALVDVIARYDAASKGNISSLRDLALPYTGAESLSSAADVRIDAGQNRFSHDGGKRTLVVSSNYQGTNIVGAVDQVKSRIEAERLPVGVTLSFEGTYKSQKENSQRLMILLVIGLILIFGILYHGFRSVSLALQIMLNIPTVLIGGMIGIWLTGGVVNLAHLVGFISLAGIVSRNGIMLISRILELLREEQTPFEPQTIVKATLERVVPVLMTSLVTALALIPLMLAGDRPGKELLHPLAIVIFGGLMSSTIISLFLTPAVFYRFGKRTIQKQGASQI